MYSDADSFAAYFDSFRIYVRAGLSEIEPTHVILKYGERQSKDRKLKRLIEERNPWTVIDIYMCGLDLYSCCNSN